MRENMLIEDLEGTATHKTLDPQSDKSMLGARTTVPSAWRRDCSPRLPISLRSGRRDDSPPRSTLSSVPSLAVALSPGSAGAAGPGALHPGTISASDAGGSTSDSHTCGVKSDGTLACWGRDHGGQRPAGTFTEVSAGGEHTCGVRSGRHPGLLDRVQHRRSSLRPPLAPFWSPLALARAAATRARSRADGTLACWGFTATTKTMPPAGPLHPDRRRQRSYMRGQELTAPWPVGGSTATGEATPPAGRFIQVGDGGLGHTCGVKSGRHPGLLGGKPSDKPRPPPGLFTQVSAGFFHTCGPKRRSHLACWGSNFVGEANPPAGLFTQVIAGAAHNCAIKSDGTVACWGDNSFGQATPPAGRFTQISAGGFHTCGLTSDGTLSCWGDNSFGPGQATPPAGLFTQVSAGGIYTGGVQSDGTRLLGEQQLRAGDAPRTANDDGAKPRASVARAEEQRCRRVARDLKVEVFADAVLIGSGVGQSVATGSSGFNKAAPQEIPLALSGRGRGGAGGEGSWRSRCPCGGHASGRGQLGDGAALVRRGQVDSGRTGRGEPLRRDDRRGGPGSLPSVGVLAKRGRGSLARVAGRGGEQHGGMSGPAVHNVRDVERDVAVR